MFRIFPISQLQYSHIEFTYLSWNKKRKKNKKSKTKKKEREKESDYHREAR